MYYKKIGEAECMNASTNELGNIKNKEVKAGKR